MSMLCITLSVDAQVYFKTEYGTPSSFKDENNLKTGGSGDLVKFQGGVSLPLHYKKNDNGQLKMLAVSLDATYAKYNNTNISTDMHPGGILNTSISMTYLVPLNSKWSLLTVVGGGIYAEPSQIETKSLLASGGALFIYHILHNFDVGIGLGITNSYGTPMALPMGYINWQIDGKYELKVNMLENMEISSAYKLNNKLKIRLIGFEMDGMSAVVDINSQSKIFGTVSMKSGFQVDFNIGKMSSLQITAGGNWYRDAVVVNRSIKDYFKWFGREYDPSFKTSLYFSIGYKYGF